MNTGNGRNYIHKYKKRAITFDDCTLSEFDL